MVNTCNLTFGKHTDLGRLKASFGFWTRIYKQAKEDGIPTGVGEDRVLLLLLLLSKRF